MPSSDRRAVISSLGLDVLAVLVFVVIGRRNHEEGNAAGDVAATALPFLVGLAAGWVSAKAWRRPQMLLTGLIIWPVTVLVGMAVRRWVFDRGTALSFVLVTTLFLGACFIGWRAVIAVSRRRHHVTVARATGRA